MDNDGEFQSYSFDDDLQEDLRPEIVAVLPKIQSHNFPKRDYKKDRDEIEKTDKKSTGTIAGLGNLLIF